jgi:hypothetical protein
MPFSETKSHKQEYWKEHFELYLKPLIERVEQVKAFRSEPLRGSIAIARAKWPDEVAYLGKESF